MQPNAIGGVRTVLWKELRESFRDWRTLFTVVVSPLLVTPALLALVGLVIQAQEREQAKERIRMGLVGSAGAPESARVLREAPNVAWVELSRPEAEAQIRERKLKAAVVFPADADRRLQGDEQVRVRMLVDPGSQSSSGAARRLTDFLERRSEKLVAERLRRHGLPTTVATPFEVKEEPIPGAGSVATLLLSTFLPYVLALAAIMGSVYAANDTVAGEKERGTLEALLVTPARRRDLVMGKFLAVATVALVSSQLSVVGLLAPFFLHVPGLDWLTRSNLKLEPAGIALMLLVQLPLAVLGAGLLMAISTFARNQKEAQSYLGPVMIMATVAAMLSMLLRVEAPLYLSLVPILNASLALKQALSGSIHWPFVLLAFGASMVYAGLTVALATRLFERETVLLKV